MYSASQAFHEAVANGNDQKSLLIFADCVFTDADIAVDAGISFNDNFNMEEDLAIGQTPSNELSFTLFNDDRLLNDYAFGDFLATIGVLIRTETYIQRGAVYVKTNLTNEYIGSREYPYITRNNVVLAQPSFPVSSILAYEGKIYVFGDDAQCVVYKDSTGENITSENKPNKFMLNKAAQWAGKGLFYHNGSRKLFIYQSGDKLTYEFVPLGWFTAERPKAPDVIRMSLTCYDFMQKFDVDMPGAAKLGITYPCTIGNLFKKMCEYVHLPYRTTVFINSTAVIQKEPDDFGHVTMREVLKWIAEAAGSNAVIDRDGYVVLKWRTNTSQSYTTNDYSEFNPYWYETRKITKLYNRDTQGSAEKTVGTGDEGYLIQDNPLLKGVG